MARSSRPGARRRMGGPTSALRFAVRSLFDPGSVPLEQGKSPLNLLVFTTPRYVMPSDVIDGVIADLRAGRIPERCVNSLQERAARRFNAMGPAPFIAGAIAFFPVLVLSRWIGGLEQSEDAPMGMLARWYMGLLVGAAVVSVLRRAGVRFCWQLALHRDLRERRLRVEEGELTGKWMRKMSSRGDPPEGRGPPRSFGKRLAAAIWDDVMWVRIGRRTHPIGSSALFQQLGTGVRYRMYLSAHAGQLVAIESVEPDHGQGYRGAPPSATNAATGG